MLNIQICLEGELVKSCWKDECKTAVQKIMLNTYLLLSGVQINGFNLECSPQASEQ